MATKTLTINTSNGIKPQLTGLIWSYAATPTSGSITISVGPASSEVQVFEIDVTTAGPGELIFPNPITADWGEQILVSMTDGGTTNRLMGFSPKYGEGCLEAT